MRFMNVAEYLTRLESDPSTSVEDSTKVEDSDTAAPRPPVVAFFDLDRTLIDGYSLTALALQQISNGGMSFSRFMSLGAMFANYAVGRYSYNDMLQATVDDITGMDEDVLRELGRAAFRERMSGWIYQEGIELISAHRRLGHQVVMVTSATFYQAEPVAEVLGIKHIRCTGLEIVSGKVAGGVQPCHGPGKLTAATEYVNEVGADLQDAYFYSDSQDDLPLLEAVGRPVVVNGKSKLKKVGDKYGWPSLQFAGKADPGAALRAADAEHSLAEAEITKKVA